MVDGRDFGECRIHKVFRPVTKFTTKAHRSPFQAVEMTNYPKLPLQHQPWCCLRETLTCENHRINKIVNSGPKNAPFTPFWA